MSSFEEYPTADALMDKITSSVKMERDGGLAITGRLTKGVNCDEGERKHLMKLMRGLIAANLTELGNKEAVANGRFSDKKIGCLNASLLLLSTTSENEEELTRGFAMKIKQDVVQIIGDQDVRVRLVAAEVFGQICKLLGPPAYLEARHFILEQLESEFQKNREIEGMVKCPQTPIDTLGETAPTEHHPHGSISPQLGSSPASSPVGTSMALSDVLKEAASLFQGSSSPGSIDLATNFGCLQLETSLKCLQFIVKGLGNDFGPFIDQNLLDLILPALQHQNRFIREAGFYLCGNLIESGLDLKSMGRRIAEEVTLGLTDFCGQARIASAITCRKFMLHLQSNNREEFLPIMLPKLCLPRYYMADAKFLLYSQETWKLIFANDGPQLVCRYIEHVISYYIEASSNDNHAVREAACMCLGELSRKIDRNVVAPHVIVLLETLKRLIHDERWHVKDAACLAAGTFFLNFPKECEGMLNNLLPMFYENLRFPISIVRQGASAALANVIRAYGTSVLPNILEQISEGLAGIEKQVSESISNVDLPLNNPELKYSYPPGHGLFAPSVPSSPWEYGDGCLFVIGDIAQIPQCSTELPNMVEKILKAVTYRSFSQHVVILETMCKILPLVVKGIGKRPFKEYLSQFWEPIFYSIESENSLTAAAGKICLKELCAIYGPNIIRSRVELHDPRFAHYVDEV